MIRQYSYIVVMLILVAVSTACGSTADLSPSGEEYAVVSSATEQREIEIDNTSLPELPANYPREVARQTLAELIAPGSTETETVLSVYNHIISHTSFATPIGLDIWRYRSDQTTLPTYVENRSLSPMLFGVGSCEDYAAAMTVLLQEAGIEAVYVAGYTFSYNGKYTDHAWVVAKIDGAWYHFDPQLEQNISDGYLSYRYYMKSDRELRPSHLWGGHLLEYVGRLATDEEAARIWAEFSPPPCIAETPAPQAWRVTLPECPDTGEIAAALDRERQVFLSSEKPARKYK